jgi:hypothetical protein
LISGIGNPPWLAAEDRVRARAIRPSADGRERRETTRHVGRQPRGPQPARRPRTGLQPYLALRRQISDPFRRRRSPLPTHPHPIRFRPDHQSRRAGYLKTLLRKESLAVAARTRHRPREYSIRRVRGTARLTSLTTFPRRQDNSTTERGLLPFTLNGVRQFRVRVRGQSPQLEIPIHLGRTRENNWRIPFRRAPWDTTKSSLSKCSAWELFSRVRLGKKSQKTVDLAKY